MSAEPFRKICLFLAVPAFLLLAVWSLVGCGGGSDSEPATETSGKTKQTAKKTAARGKEKSGPISAEHLSEIKMAKWLKPELFYEGDRKYELRATYNPSSGKLAFTLGKASKKQRKRSSKSKGISRVKDVYTGIYQSDRIQGPYKLAGRFLGAPHTLPDEFALDDVNLMYCRAVTYSSEGKPQAFTDPVKPGIKLPALKKSKSKRSRRSSKAKPKSETKSAEKSSAKASDADSKKTPVKPTAPLKIAVVMFLDNNVKRPAEYLERSLSDELSKALSASPGLKVSRRDLLQYAMTKDRIDIRDVLKSKSLSVLSKTLMAQKLIFGNFWLSDGKLRVKLMVADTATDAHYMIADLSNEFGAAAEIAELLLSKLSENLAVEIPQQAREVFSKRLVELAALPDKIAELRKLLAEGNLTQAIGLFEKIKADDVRDPDILTAMTRVYAGSGNHRRAVESLVARTKIRGGLKKDNEVQDFAAALKRIGDLTVELDLLGMVKLHDKTTHWKVARTLVEHAVGKGKAEFPTDGRVKLERTWPIVSPGLKIQSDELLLNPTTIGDSIIFFASKDRETLKVFANAARRKSLGGLTEMKVFDATHFVTSSYTTAGTMTWRSAGLMTPTVKPIEDGELIYGVRKSGLIAVESRTGKVRWESKEKLLTVPEKKHSIEGALFRPWWRTWELRVVDSCIVAWDPDGDRLHTFRKADGAHVGSARFQKLGNFQERMLLEKDGKFHYLERGNGAVKELTAADLANPHDLEPRLCLVANNRYMIEDGIVYEIRQRIASKKNHRKRHLYYVLSTEAAGGKFNWMQLVVNDKPPVICKGKLYWAAPRKSAKSPTLVQVIDPSSQQTKNINLTELALSDVTPRGPLLGGSAILLGARAALRIPDYKLLWVNRKLPLDYDPVILEDVVSIGPFLVKPDTGAIMAEMDTEKPLNWNEASLSGNSARIVVCANETLTRGQKVIVRGTLLVFEPTGQQTSPAGSEPGRAKPVKLKREPLELDAVEKAVWASRVVPQPGPDRWNLQTLIADWKFQKTGKHQDAIDYLCERAGQPARTPHGPFNLIKLTRPYFLLTGKMEPYVKIVRKIGEDFPGSTIADALKTEVASADEEIAKLAAGQKILKKLQAAEPNPSMDFPSRRGSAGMIGSVGAGVTPPFTQKWSCRIGNRSTDNSLIMPVGDKIVVVTGSVDAMKVVSAVDGKIIWGVNDVTAAACYRGVVFVIRERLEARDLATGTVLWRAALPPDRKSGNPVVAAGADRCFLWFGGDVRAYQWDTGKTMWSSSMPACDRLELSGNHLLAGSVGRNTMTLFDVSSGAPRWTLDSGSYAVHDGHLYTVERIRTARGIVDIQVERYVLLSARPDWSIVRTLSSRGRVKNIPPPVVTGEHLLVAYGENLLSLNPVNGGVRWKQTLPQHVTAGMTASATTVFVGLSNSDLRGFDLTKTDGTDVVKLPTVGASPTAMGDGMLYVLKRGELLAMSGTSAPHPKEYVARINNPTGRTPKTVTKTSLDEKGPADIPVKSGRFVPTHCVNSRSGLISAMRFSGIYKAAFEVLLDYGSYDLLKRPAERFLLVKHLIRQHRPELAPATVAMPQLGQPQKVMFANELVQRRTPEAVPLLITGVAGRLQSAAPAIEVALRDARPSIYAPRLLVACKKSLSADQFGPSREAIRLLGHWKYGPAIPFLTEHAKDKRFIFKIRIACIQALGMYQTPNTRNKLASMVVTGMDDFRLTKAAADTLALGGSAGIKTLNDVLFNRIAKIESRMYVAETIGKSKTPQARQILQKALGIKSMPKELRATCAMALGLTQHKSVVPVLVKVMNGPNSLPLIRNACLNGLAVTKCREAVPHMIDAIAGNADNRQFSRDTAAQLLRRVTGVNFGSDKEKWENWYDLQKDKPWKTGI